jgi:hypothetical protein
VLNSSNCQIAYQTFYGTSRKHWKMRFVY